MPALLALVARPGIDTVAFAARGLGVLKEPHRGRGAAVARRARFRADAASSHRRSARSGRSARASGRTAAARSPRRREIDANVRLEAVTALGGHARRGRLRPPARPGRRIAGPTSAAPRCERWRAIDPDTFVTMLSALDPDPAWQVRADLAGVLGTLDRERALPAALPRCSTDSDHAGDRRRCSRRSRAVEGRRRRRAAARQRSPPRT